MIVKRQMQLHHAVSVIGGFWGGYTIFNHSDIFSNAQTGNLIKLVLHACSGQLESIGYMVLLFAVYAAANAFYVIARKKLRLSMKIVSFIVSAAAVIATGALSLAGNHYLAVLPLAFAAPVQWNAFKTAGGNSSATVFSSNNVRQAVMLLTKYFLDKDRRALLNARFYWATLGCFHLGVAASCLLSLPFGVHSIWFCLLPVAAAVFFYYRYKQAKLDTAQRLDASVSAVN